MRVLAHRFHAPSHTGECVVKALAWPPIAIALPLFLMFIALERAVPAIGDFGLKDSTLALAILYASFAFPLCVWLMRAAFRSVPADLEEAASAGPSEA